jgi:oligopeptidase B
LGQISSGRRASAYCARGARWGAEELLLDGPVLAEGKPYFSFGDYHHSPDHRLFAYAVDETGSESYRLRIRDLRSSRDLPEEGRRVLEIVALAGHLVRLEREDGLERLVIRRKADGDEHVVIVDEEVYSLELQSPYEFDTCTIRFSYSSLVMPKQVFDYDAASRERVLRKQQRIPSGHDRSAYMVRRLAVPAAHNEQVPITVLYRKDLPVDGSAPLYLEGYGAYSYVFPISFNSKILSLVDRGMVYAIAHVRGGLEKGERWRDAGRLPNKPNTFTDFITVAEYLNKAGYAAPGRIVARGDSAGGLLMGAVANMRPDLFAGIVARVPFVDVLNTMLDETLPLTVSDFSEWGDPIRDVAAYRSIAQYAPYENVGARPYPHILVTTGLSDLRVSTGSRRNGSPS